MVKNAEDIILKKSKKINGIAVKGPSFDNGLDIDQIIDNFGSIGFQASHLNDGINALKEMYTEKEITVFLGFTSNAISCGIREYIRWIVKNKKADVLITTAGGVEEDVIKLFGDFIMGSWNVDDVKLREDGINRTGNVFVPNNLYVEFEGFMTKLFTRLLKEKETWTPKEFVYQMGKDLEDFENKDESYIYWAYKNKIPMYCMTLLDGSIGDMLYFFNQNREKKLKIEVFMDDAELKRIAINAKKTGGIMLGGGTAKHQFNNTNLFREGLDYAIYITTANLWDGSVSGAISSEGQSWGKVSANAKHVDVICDFTIAFPLIFYSVFK